MAIAIKQSLDFGKSFWKENHFKRGKILDHLLGQNIPHNSKAIDRTVDLNCIISHKSTDFRNKSYQNQKVIYHLGVKYVNELANYAGEIRRNHKIGATYHLHWATDNPDCKRILEWYFPAVTMLENLESILDDVIAYANMKKVQIDIYTIIDY